MDKQEVYDYLEVEFNVTDPSQLSQKDRHVAYERLKHRLLHNDLSPDEYTKEIINLSDHLQI